MIFGLSSIFLGFLGYLWPYGSPLGLRGCDALRFVSFARVRCQEVCSTE